MQTDSDGFLKEVKGVIHVGAHTGQEREIYAAHGLSVAWIEPNPELFPELQGNLRRHPKQQAFQYLVTDRNGQDYEFHISNNYGGSSSILELHLHKQLWPQIAYSTNLTLQSVTLTSLVEKENLALDDYDALVMDTQGSELLVLKGAQELLPRFHFIKTEVADFEAYRDCCRLDDIDEFLGQFGFQQCDKRKFASAEGVGSYYNVTYRKMCQ